MTISTLILVMVLNLTSRVVEDSDLLRVVVCPDHVVAVHRMSTHWLSGTAPIRIPSSVVPVVMEVVGLSDLEPRRMKY